MFSWWQGVQLPHRLRTLAAVANSAGAVSAVGVVGALGWRATHDRVVLVGATL